MHTVSASTWLDAPDLKVAKSYGVPGAERKISAAIILPCGQERDCRGRWMAGDADVFPSHPALKELKHGGARHRVLAVHDGNVDQFLFLHDSLTSLEPHCPELPNKPVGGPHPLL